MPAPVLHQALVENLGQAIVDGDIPTGTALILEDVMHRCQASRTVAREAVRVLETLGMVAMKRRIGNVVLPRSSWRVSDSRIIRWRLSGRHRQAELDDLMQLRAGIEPIAARLTARSAGAPHLGRRLEELSALMAQLGGDGEGVSAQFLAADIEFHRLLVTSSGNDHIRAFSDTLEVVLIERNRLGLLGDYPDPRAMRAHQDIARAVSEQSPTRAEQATRQLVDVVHREVLSPSPAGKD